MFSESEVTKLRQEFNTLVEELAIYCPSHQEIIWFDNIPCYVVETWKVKTDKYGSQNKNIEVHPNLAKPVEKLLSLYRQLCQAKHLDSEVSSSNSFEPLWENSGPKWPGICRKVTEVRISSNLETRGVDALPRNLLKNAIKELISKIDDLWRDECLVVHGFPTYYELSLYVLLLTGTLFEKTGLVLSDGHNITFFFYMFDRWNPTTRILLKRVQTEINDINPNQLYISGSYKFFDCGLYKAITDMNYVHLGERIRVILDCVNLGASKKVDNHRQNVKTQMFTKCQKPLSLSARKNNDESCADLSLWEEVELASTFLDQLSCSDPVGDEGVLWLELTSSDGLPKRSLVKRSNMHSTFHIIEISKFCSRPLLQCFMKLSKILQAHCHVNLKPRDSGKLLMSFRQYSWFDLFKNAHVHDFGIEPWFNLHHHREHELKSLKSLLSLIMNLKENDCIVLRCYPMLSELNVSVVFILGHIFEKFGFLIPDEFEETVLLFFKYRKFKSTVESHFERVLMESDVVSLVPLSSILDGDFYNSIRDVNNASLKLQSLQMLRCLKEM